MGSYEKDMNKLSNMDRGDTLPSKTKKSKSKSPKEVTYIRNEQQQILLGLGTSKERSGPVDREHTANLMKTLHGMRADGIGCDLRVECKDGEFEAHSVVLHAAGLEDRMKNITNGVLNFSDLPSSGVSALLDYLYLGRARLSLENGLSALEVSRRLNMRDLFDKCRKFICPFMLDPAKLSMNGINATSMHSPELMTDDDGSVIDEKQPSIMDHKPAVSARQGRSDFKIKTGIEKVEKSAALSDRIKKHIEEIEQPKNLANMPQPANMLVNKRALPIRGTKTSHESSKDADQSSGSETPKLSKLKIASPKSSRVSSDDSGTLTPSSSDNDSDEDSNEDSESHVTESEMSQMTDNR